MVMSIHCGQLWIFLLCRQYHSASQYAPSVSFTVHCVQWVVLAWEWG